MKYSELEEQYEEQTYIPYAELLLTDEWKEKRALILQRDTHFCTSCHSGASIYIHGRHLYYTDGDYVKQEQIVRTDLSRAFIKDTFKIEEISILRSSFHSNCFFGASNNGILFACRDWNLAKEFPIDELLFHFIILDSGYLMPFIDIPVKELNEENILLPKFSDRKIQLHVHHNFYIHKNLPWDYEDDALITLCNWCHWELHQKEAVPVYTMDGTGELYEMSYELCSRCGGAGFFPEYEHVQRGVCFQCGGARYFEARAFPRGKTSL